MSEKQHGQIDGVTHLNTELTREEGKQSFHAGRGYRTNPYLIKNEGKRELWFQGWMEAWHAN